MSEDRLSSLSVLHIHKHKELDVNEVISEFARRKNRRLASSLTRLVVAASRVAVDLFREEKSRKTSGTRVMKTTIGRRK